MEKTVVKIPTLAELVEETPESRKETALMVILNQNPPEKWLKEHPVAKGVKYLPIERVEYILNRIYGGYKTDVKNVQILLNSIQVTVRVTVINPITDDEEYQEGVGAWPIQTKAGTTALDIANVKSNGVQLATPAAETEAIKDACHKFGRIFGGSLNRATESDYDSLLPKQTEIDELSKLYKEKKHLCSEEECKRFDRIIDNKEENSYNKILTILKSK